MPSWSGYGFHAKIEPYMEVEGHQAFHPGFNQTWIVPNPGINHCHIRCWDLDIKENRRTEIKGVWDGLFEKDIGSHKKGQNTEHKNKGSASVPQRCTSIVRAKKLKYFGHIKRMDNNRYPKILLEGHIEGNPEGDRHQTLLWKWKYPIGGSSRTSSKKQRPMATESSWEAISGTNLGRKALSQSKSIHPGTGKDTLCSK